LIWKAPHNFGIPFCIKDKWSTHECHQNGNKIHVYCPFWFDRRPRSGNRVPNSPELSVRRSTLCHLMLKATVCLNWAQLWYCRVRTILRRLQQCCSACFRKNKQNCNVVVSRSYWDNSESRNEILDGGDLLSVKHEIGFFYTEAFLITDPNAILRLKAENSRKPY
jgi:hypothetical protein